jgi:hypothetical protein
MSEELLVSFSALWSENFAEDQFIDLIAEQIIGEGSRIPTCTFTESLHRLFGEGV